MKTNGHPIGRTGTSRRRRSRCRGAAPPASARGCAVRWRARPNTAAPMPRPMSTASRIIVNEKTDEPSSTASARVHITCSVIAVAPDTTKASSAARRERASSDRLRRQRGRVLDLAPRRRRVEPLVELRLPCVGPALRRAGTTAPRQRSMAAAASVMLNAAAVTLVQARPKRARRRTRRGKRRRPRRTGSPSRASRSAARPAAAPRGG